ncbi:enoyl-CoA hydratase [Parvibaculum sp.]|uniref:enoyl-CoA hydratase n=1 Tax=Parvibaculum sp. TaxID=2024848 RepID=UPI0027309802|nr:enoyl-CoA hydratase [Parvibaculum sp.]MDP1627164.1 enoyl-CoA hydratase [Parvibaculum sp.]MDP2148870.1 enoyl-CoA hydratase [Parvibaculum sp.]MDP3329893.1 enoyl-CoA hydratase [Parvibaculum sp.]
MSISSPTPKMIAAKDGAIGWMIFNNPERLNAVSLDMWQAVPEILSAFEHDDEIRVIVLKGAGDRAFVAGADISQFGESRSSAEGILAYETATEIAFDGISNASKPTIAMIDGYCIGGGLGIALSCDLRIAADGSTFGIPAAKLGLAYGAGGTGRLVHVVGPSFAKEIFYTARRFTCDEALAMGLVNRVTTKEALENFTRDYCTTIAENAPLTVGTAKQVVDEFTKAPGNFDAAKCDALIARCFASDDYKEGRAAFMEKRKPVFKGK